MKVASAIVLTAIGFASTTEGTVVSALGSLASGSACRCTGTWELDTSSFTVFDGSDDQLKTTDTPITLQLWPTEATDKRSMRGSLNCQPGNIIGFVVGAVRSGGFCDKSVELLSGAVSTRRFAWSAAAKNEKILTTKIIQNLNYWDCQERKGSLIIGSPEATVAFRKVEATPLHDEN